MLRHLAHQACRAAWQGLGGGPRVSSWTTKPVAPLCQASRVMDVVIPLEAQPDVPRFSFPPEKETEATK